MQASTCPAPVRWDDDLNKEQKEACSVPVGHRCVLAGPGTGKTRVITHRVAWLGQEAGVRAREIVVLTFTRAAASELRQRLVTDFGEDFGETRVSTLHAFALRQLIRNGVEPGTDIPLVIADDYDEREVIWPDLRDRLEWDNVDQVKDALAEIAADYATLAAEKSDWAQRHRHTRVITALDEHKRVFQYMLRNELVFRFYRAMVTIPSFQVEHFEHLLVDEYQDLTPLETHVIHLLVDRGAVLYAAGDDDQAIYGWRGATPEAIRGFESDYGANSYKRLQVCQRCDSDVVGFSQAVIVQDLARTSKDLAPRTGAERGRVWCRSFKDQTGEAEGVAETCAVLRDEERIKPGEILVLVRGRRYAGPIMNEIAKRMPVASPQNPYGQFEEGDGRVILLYLRLLQKEDDNLAWRELIRLQGGFGEQPLIALREDARLQGKTFTALLRDVVARGDRTGLPRAKALAAYVVDVLERLAGIREAETGVIASDLDVLAAAIPVTDASLVALLNEAADELAGEARTPVRLRDLSQIVAGQRPEIDEETAKETGVRVMTMHNAKGLTADAVILAAAEHEVLHPRIDPLQDPEQIRLIYVSVTRARHHVAVTFASQRTGPQAHPAGTGKRRLSDVLARAGLAEDS